MARFLLLFSFLVAGCALSATDTAIKATKDSVITLEKSLIPACKTDAITSQITSINSQIDSISSTCKAEVYKEKAEKHSWQVVCLSLVILIVAYLWRKIKL